MEKGAKRTKSYVPMKFSGKNKTAIVIGTFLFFGLVAFLIYWFVLRDKHSCEQDNCTSKVYCRPKSDEGLENIATTEDFREKLREFVGVQKLTLTVTESGGISGLTEQGNILSDAVADFTGGYVNKNPGVLKSDTGKEVKCGEIGADVQYINADAGSGIVIPKDLSFVQIGVRHVLPGQASDIIGYTTESRDAVCAFVDCQRSNYALPKPGFKGGDCPRCDVFESP